MNISISVSMPTMMRHGHSHGRSEDAVATSIGDKLVSKLDQDQDGGLSASELEGTKLGKKLSIDQFSKIDGDGDGKLTADELNSNLKEAGLRGRREGWGRHNHHFHNHRGDSADAVSQLAGVQQAKAGTTETTTTFVAFEQTTTNGGSETTTRFLAYQSSTSTTSGAATDAPVEAEAVTAEELAAPAEQPVETAEQAAEIAEQPAATSEAIELANAIDAADGPDSAVELAEEVAAEAAAAETEEALTPEEAKVAEVLEQALAEGMSKEDLIELVEDVVSGDNDEDDDTAVEAAVDAVSGDTGTVTTTNVLALAFYSKTVTTAAAA